MSLLFKWKIKKLFSKVNCTVEMVFVLEAPSSEVDESHRIFQKEFVLLVGFF